MSLTRVECPFGASTLILETGKLAKQAHAAVLVQYGDVATLVTVVEGSAKEGQDFFPLTVDYREKVYAAGKFPGGYIKREGRPSIKETLVSRIIDRPIRPLFPTNYVNELQVMAMVMSADKDNDPDITAMIGANAALHISHVPFLAPSPAVRIGRINGEFVVMPTYSQMEESDLDLVVAGTKDAITMIEGFARELPEDVMTAAILFAHEQIIKLVEFIESFREAMGLPKKQLPPPPEPNPLVATLFDKYGTALKEAKLIKPKLERYGKVAELKDQIIREMVPEDGSGAYTSSQISAAFGSLEEKVFRDIVLGGNRIDGRAPKELRSISCEVGTLPRTHGSGLFQRGETQALVVATLGTMADEQKVEGLTEEYSKKFMLDYNFPPFSVGEARPIRTPGRREIGHGMLAERSLKAVIPAPAKFPYTIRLVSEILESNGSSSMASVSGGTLALMDAGVPITQPVAGISVGLVKEGDQFVLLTDIQGDEDHFGDMDFKVAGTPRGVTGIQLDIKIDGINEAIVRGALEQAKDARREILRNMLIALSRPRKSISEFAPRMLQMKINPEKIGLLIGPGGKTIRAIQETTGAKIDIEDDGTVYISHHEAAGAEAAKAKVEALTEEVKVGKIYEGKVSSIKDFGAFVEITPGRDGLCHVSELDHNYVSRVEDIVKVGDKVSVKVIGIDDQDRIKLSRKALMPMPEGGVEQPPPRQNGDRGNDRGDRGGDRGGRGGPRGRGGDRGDRPRD